MQTSNWAKLIDGREAKIHLTMEKDRQVARGI